MLHKELRWHLQSFSRFGPGLRGPLRGWPELSCGAGKKFSLAGAEECGHGEPLKLEEAGKGLTVTWFGDRDWGWDWDWDWDCQNGNGQGNGLLARVGAGVILVRGDQNRAAGLICKDKTKRVIIS